MTPTGCLAADASRPAAVATRGRRLLLVLAALAALPAAAQAQVPGYASPPGTPPLLCRGSAFVDFVGRGGDDVLTAPNRASRLWGLGGDDVLSGSSTRISCLLGGKGDDVLFLNAGGGVADGNAGRDVISGSGLGDVIDGGRDTDAVAAAGGDDKVFVRDGRPEVVDCGKGSDQVKGDRSDVLIGCESTNLAGKALRTVAAHPRSTHVAGRVSFTLTGLAAARRGAYRVDWVDSCRARALTQLERLGRVRAKKTVRVRLRRPLDGWCRGRNTVVVVRATGQTRPLTPVARLAFTVR